MRIFLYLILGFIYYSSCIAVDTNPISHLQKANYTWENDKTLGLVHLVTADFLTYLGYGPFSANSESWQQIRTHFQAMDTWASANPEEYRRILLASLTWLRTLEPYDLAISLSKFGTENDNIVTDLIRSGTNNPIVDTKLINKGWNLFLDVFEHAIKDDSLWNIMMNTISPQKSMNYLYYESPRQIETQQSIPMRKFFISLRNGMDHLELNNGFSKEIANNISKMISGLHLKN